MRLNHRTCIRQSCLGNHIFRFVSFIAAVILIGGIICVILATTKCITDEGRLKIYIDCFTIEFHLIFAMIAIFLVNISDQNYQKDAADDKMDFHQLIKIDGQLHYKKKTNISSFFELKQME